jgi:Ca-activated chloride channel family protein
MNTVETPLDRLDVLTDRLQGGELTKDEAQELAVLLKSPEARRRFVSSSTFMAAAGDEASAKAEQQRAITLAAGSVPAPADAEKGPVVANVKSRMHWWPILSAAACLAVAAFLFISHQNRPKSQTIACESYRYEHTERSQTLKPYSTTSAYDSTSRRMIAPKEAVGRIENMKTDGRKQPDNADLFETGANIDAIGRAESTRLESRCDETSRDGAKGKTRIEEQPVSPVITHERVEIGDHHEDDLERRRAGLRQNKESIKKEIMTGETEEKNNFGKRIAGHRAGSLYSETKKLNENDKLPATMTNRDDLLASGDKYVNERPYVRAPEAYNRQAPGTESYEKNVEKTFLNPIRKENALSTFSLDVDTASYSNTRRFLSQNQLPPQDAVRIEEFINYFKYDYPQPSAGRPFSLSAELGACPWNPGNRIIHVGLQAKSVSTREILPSNLVFLIDVSGSMDEPKKLPLLKEGLKLLADQMGAQDRIAVVTYADAATVALPSTPGSNRTAIKNAIENLRATGSTNGADGIQTAYRVARQNFIKKGVNRVILATDGDFNVGVTNQDDLVKMIEAERKTGVFLTALGFGMGNLKDATLVKLADKGNGHYAYVDTLEEAKKVLVREMSGTLQTIAKDVKVQVEFNPRRVAWYRLLGYEKRALQNRDFNNDAADAGEIGAGHTVTALYEITPAPVAGMEPEPGVDPLRYQLGAEDRPLPPATGNALDRELLTLKLRYKEPDEDASKLLSVVVTDAVAVASPSDNFRFAAAVAMFGMILRDSPHCGSASYETVLSLARNALGNDPDGTRREFITLVEKAASLRR